MNVDRFRIEVPVTVPFHDIDMIGVAWHGHYAKYFEIARCALLERLDYGYDAMRESGFMWPVIDMRIRYIKPLRFGQRVIVKAILKDWENRLLIEYLVTDEATGHRLTKGTTSQVAVDIASGEMCFVSPQVLLDRLGVS
jgi:acyl-CoA thioester hydrolase